MHDRRPGTTPPVRRDTAEQRAREASFARGHAGEIAHGVEMLRHWWPGSHRGMHSWLVHLERYAPRLVESVDALAATVERQARLIDAHRREFLAECEIHGDAAAAADCLRDFESAALGDGEQR